MPSVIDPVGPNTGAVTYAVTYLKADGSPGEVQSSPTVTLQDPTLGTVVPGVAGPSVFQFDIVHNGSAGTTNVVCGEVDGDLGEGEFLIGPFTDSVEFTPVALGAETGTFAAVGPQHAPAA